MRYGVAGVVMAALALPGCGGSEIDNDQATAIAEKSQDYELHSEIFTESIVKLGGEKGCQADYMMEQGGFWKSGDGDYYYIRCGTLYGNGNVQTWYLNPSTEVLTRYKSQI